MSRRGTPHINKGHPTHVNGGQTAHFNEGPVWFFGPKFRDQDQDQSQSAFILELKKTGPDQKKKPKTAVLNQTSVWFALVLTGLRPVFQQIF